MRKPNVNRTAIHESGHFVFAKMMDLGRIKRMTCVPSQGLSGCVVRTPLPMEIMLRAESRGEAPESALVQDSKTCDDLAAYRANKVGFVNQLVIMTLAGAAADTELSDGNGTLGKSDYFQARDLALTIMPATEVGPFLTKRMAETRELCRGPLRHTILAVAERLLTKRTMQEDDLIALWAEVDPRANALPEGRVSHSSPWSG